MEQFSDSLTERRREGELERRTKSLFCFKTKKLILLVFSVFSPSLRLSVEKIFLEF